MYLTARVSPATDDTNNGQTKGSFTFLGTDVSVGVENEFQTAVIGTQTDVDLPQAIKNSDYFCNMRRRVARGDVSAPAGKDLEDYLANNKSCAWENSWVRFPAKRLGREAHKIFEGDLLADKTKSDGPERSDKNIFLIKQAGEAWIRIPVSYMLKLALVDVAQRSGDPCIKRVASKIMNCFQSDNTSPEVTSFFIVAGKEEISAGEAAARETALRFLAIQLLTAYANRAFGLIQYGQTAVVYTAPHPPLRQKHLNEIVSDSFYRELFMSPCLSGWDKGEEKKKYMELCHQTLSRSSLNAVGKLIEAGIITRNLVVVPRVSNISLANNGVHISLGSFCNKNRITDRNDSFDSLEEKRTGDLVTKIVEHFLPLFVGTYSAAPYRLAFTDFHPELVLGFLPHELDYTHLRMLWRRWKKRAKIKLFGQTITPFGPLWLDKTVAFLLRLKGHYVPDFRLLDYPVALLSTQSAQALDGTIGNQEKLRDSLDRFGIFDRRMSVYLPIKQRHFDVCGYSGFEIRTHSLFPSFRHDFAKAIDLQSLIVAYAHRLVESRKIRHEDIPDTPFIESERRQILFGSAIGLPTFYVSAEGSNRFLAKIAAKARGVRSSGRYAGYIRVKHEGYRQALVDLLEDEGAELVTAGKHERLIADLKARLGNTKKTTAQSRLVNGILKKSGVSSPMALKAEEFNQNAEEYYRDTLRKEQTAEGFDYLEEEVPGAKKNIQSIRKKFESDTATKNEIAKLIQILLRSIEGDIPR